MEASEHSSIGMLGSNGKSASVDLDYTSSAKADKQRRRNWAIPLEHIPRIFSIMKWLCLIVIAVSTATVGFLQSLLVSALYAFRASFIYQVVERGTDVVGDFFEYVAFNLGLAFLSTFSLYAISPAASGSGIPDVKAFLNGVDSPIFAQFFRIRTFVAKVLGSAFAVSASLIMGKEGPMLHAGSILAVILGTNKWMQQQMEIAAHWGVYTYNKELRDLVAVGAACGVTTAFKAPVGGVLFAMEMSTRWRQELTWRAFMACAITVVVVRLWNLLCVNYGKCDILQYGSLSWFQMSNMASPYQQVLQVMLLACIGGYLGSLFTSFNTWICLVRKKWGKIIWARMLEVCVISVITSVVFFFLPLAGTCKVCDPNAGSSTVVVSNSTTTSDHCFNGNDVKFKRYTLFKCHQPNQYNDMAVLVFNPQGFIIQALFQTHSGTFSIGTLILYAFVYWLMAAITYGAFIPSGLFTPSLIFGGCIGRIFAEILLKMHLCTNTQVGMYALMGAAGFLGGLMRMSAAMALILMEMSQAPAQLPFLMMSLVLAKNVGDHFNYSVFDHQMMLKGLQFVGIDEKKAQKSKLMARDVMTRNNRNRTLYITESASVLEAALEVHKDVDAFPVTTPAPDENTPGNFVGMISRKNIVALLDIYGSDAEGIDLLSKVEVAPIIIPPNMPLPFIYRVVNAEGFNYVPVIRTHGPLEGIVSRTELVEVQNKTLDEFHLKDQISKMTEDLDHGKIIESMNLTGNIHATKFKAFIQNPVQSTKNYLQQDDKPMQEQTEFFVDRESLGMPPAGSSALARTSAPRGVNGSHPGEHAASSMPAIAEVEPDDAVLERQPLVNGDSVPDIHSSGVGGGGTGSTGPGR